MTDAIDKKLNDDGGGWIIIIIAIASLIAISQCMSNRSNSTQIPDLEPITQNM